jgi:hypothetical protein
MFMLARYKENVVSKPTLCATRDGTERAILFQILPLYFSQATV